jgi:hypothetical protein
MVEFFCRIYVDKEEIYAGDLKEVPEKFRAEIREAFVDWADSLGKRGINELVYSLFTWYETRGMYCQKCEQWVEEYENCSACGGKLEEKFIHERNKKLDLLLTCVGMISRIEVIR